MTSEWRSIGELILEFGGVIKISVIGTDGSTPRDAGASMLVWCDGTDDTIGGGRLEFEAIGKAREMLGTLDNIDLLWRRQEVVYPLGPTLGQCCGGAARLLFEVFTTREQKLLDSMLQGAPMPALLVRPTQSSRPAVIATDRKTDYQLPVSVARVVKDMLSGARPRVATYMKMQGDTRTSAWFIEPVGETKTPLYIYGAGHVGRAVVVCIAPLCCNALGFDVQWIDTTRDRYPRTIPDHVTPVISARPSDIVEYCLPHAFHLVLTFSHALDLAICHGLLARGDFAFLGLIGSQTKRARFLKRLRDGGITDSMLARLTCPIGISGIGGKEPAMIAISVAAQLIETLELSQQQNSHSRRRTEHV